MSLRLISVKNASVTLHSHGQHFQVLKNINFTLKKGEHIAILGENGAGKSTFLRVLAGETWIDNNFGSIAWLYNGVAENSPIMARRMTALVSASKQEQYTRYNFILTGLDILLTSFSKSHQNLSEIEQHQKAYHMAKQLNCEALLRMQAHALSQGQLRLLLLGQAILQEPKVLLLDEYLDGLDSSTRQHLFEILKQISSNTSLVISTHRTQSLVPWVNKKLYLYNGQLHSAPTTIKTVAQSTIVQNPKKILQNTTQPIIALKNATVFVQRVAVLHRISWELHKNENWCIEGSNGAGKSTFLRLLAGDEHPAVGGSIKRHFSKLYPHEQNTTKLEHIRHAMHLVSDHEQACYGYNLTALELILSGIDNVMGTYKDYDSVQIENALALLKNFGLSLLEKRRIRTLSTGQLRRLFIARAFISNPEVLLLDEPFSGLDKTSRHQCMNNIENLAGDVCVILVSHHLDDHVASINRNARLENGFLFS